jgi:hypothetical protein
MTKDEALQIALEALEGVLDDSPKVLDASISGGLYEVVQCRDAITAIKAALEAKDESWEQFYPEMGKPKLAYLSPTELPENYCYILPQRTWIELTEDEIVLISADCAATHQHTDIHFARAIEAKLKEKNT